MKYFFVLILAPLLGWGAICDDVYDIKSATQVILSGGDPKHLGGREVKTLSNDFSDLEALHQVLEYKLMAGFAGSCGKEKKPIQFRVRPALGSAFTSTSSGDFFIQLHDSTAQPNGIRYQYWFGFYRPADTLQGFVGRFKDGATLFSNWYAAMTVIDSVRNEESGLWSAKTTLHGLQGPSDSLSLDKSMLDGPGYRSIAYNENHRAYFKLQFIKVSYGPVAASGVRRTEQPRNTSQPFYIYNVLGRVDRK